MDECERIAWRQLHKVCGHYPICIIAPESLLENCEDRFQHKIVTFPDMFFRDIHTYSQLLMTKDFYQRFIKYEYILIYQLDAFIFSDRLKYFLSLGYDYIGAPLPRWSNYWYSMKTRPGMLYIPFLGRVGNGGLSLRKVSAMINILKKKDEIFATHPLARLFQEQEDMFFTYCGTLEDGLNIADVRIARQFSVEMDVGHCYRNLDKHLPFGCHAWYKIAFSVWENLIKAEGYDLTLSTNVKDFNHFRRIVLSFYLMERMLRKENRERIKDVLSSILIENSYAVWGVGKYGKLLLCWLCNAGIKVDCAFDGRATAFMEYYDVPIMQPEYSLVQKYRKRLIIGTVDSKEDIIRELEKMGFHKEDFMTMEEFMKLLLDTYFNNQQKKGTFAYYVRL